MFINNDSRHMTKVFDEAGSFRIDSRVGLISEVFNGDFAAFVAGLKVSFLCFFRYLNLELFGAKSWFSNKAENRIPAFAVSFVRCGCFIFSFTLCRHNVL